MPSATISICRMRPKGPLESEEKAWISCVSGPPSDAAAGLAGVWTGSGSAGASLSLPAVVPAASSDPGV